MENTLEGINRLVSTEEWISDLEDGIVEITQSEQQNEKRILKSEDSVRDLWDNIEGPNVHITEILKREESEKWAEKIFEDVMAANSPNLGEGNRYPGPEDTKSFKQDESKEIHNKKYCN